LEFKGVYGNLGVFTSREFGFWE